MRPIAFHLGAFPVHTYGLMGAIGFVVVSFIVLRRARALMLNRDRVVDVIFWTSLAGLVGSRAVFVFQHADKMAGPSDWINIRAGGLVFYGALLTGLPVAALLMRRYKIPFFPFLDIMGTALPIGHALARLGCFAAGCCYGVPTDLPWGVTFSHPLTDAPHDVALHPVQLYEAAGLAAIALGCHVLYTRKQFHGQVMVAYLLGYAVLRAVLELWRGDAGRGFFLEGLLGQTLSTSQGLSIVVALVALGVLVWQRRRAATRSSAA